MSVSPMNTTRSPSRNSNGFGGAAANASAGQSIVRKNDTRFMFVKISEGDTWSKHSLGARLLHHGHYDSFLRVPTILREKGYRIGFYSSEPDEPVHVHVHKDGHEAKFWLAPVQLSWNKGFRDVELREIARILEAHETELIEAWNAAE